MLGALRRLGSDRQGNFAVISAVLALPVLLGIGMALDTSAIRRTKVELQNATDAAVIAIAREGVTISDDRALAIADEMVSGDFGYPYSGLKVKRIGTSFSVGANAVADTVFGGLLGYGDWTVSAVSTADIALVPYEIALVLDTTGSMKGGKLQAMKDAVLGLVDTMSANVTVKDNLKFAMVPFSSFVNVGPQFAPKFDKKGKIIEGTGAEWLDVKGDVDVVQTEFAKGVSRFEIFHNLGQEWAGCVETRDATKKVAYDVSDAMSDKKVETGPAKIDDEALFVPALSIDEPDDKRSSGAAIYANSYIKSSADPFDKSLLGRIKMFLKYGLAGLLPGDFSGGMWQSPANLEIAGGKGPNASCVTQPIVPLSTDYAGIKTKVGALAANGNTNIMEGVAWGWRVLSPGAPFTQGASKKSNTRKIMIVLTDGSNVFGVSGDGANKLGSTYSSFGYKSDQRLMPVPSATVSGTNTAMNDRTLKACTNAKADGIEIFTIRLEEPDKATGMMLKDCASAPDHFFDAPSRSQLDEVFGQIRDKITTVRISS
jgi:Mg-chelatase subunit ChlD